MRNFNKIFITAMASTTLFMACSEPEVSEEVKALRQTQADLLAERVEKQKLDNALQALENALFEAESAAAIAQANLAAQQAADDLEQYLRTQGLEQAAELLAQYTGALGDASAKQGDIIDQESLIARMQQLIGADNPNTFAEPEEGEGEISFELAAEIIQRDLDELNAVLTAQEAALASLEAVQADPSSAQEESSQLLAQIQDLENQNAILMVDLAKADNAAELAWNALNDAESTIEDYETAVSEVPVAQQNIADKQDEITAKQDEITGLEADLVEANTELAVAQAALNDAEAALAPYLAALATAETAHFVAINAEYTAQINYSIVEDAVNNGDADPAELIAAGNALAEASQAQANAKNAVDEAYFDVHGDFPDCAPCNGEGPQDTYDFALFIRDFTQGPVDDINDNITTENDNLADLQAELVQLQETLADKEGDVADLQQAYDDAVENLVALEDAYEETVDAYSVIADEDNANDAMIENLQGVVDAIDGELESINKIIEDTKDAIEVTKASVEDKQKMLANNSISLDEWNAEIEKEQTYLAQLETEYNALVALAEAYLAAYNDALASQAI